MALVILGLLFAFSVEGRDGRDGAEQDFGSDLNGRGLTTSLTMARGAKGGRTLCRRVVVIVVVVNIVVIVVVIHG